MLLLWSSRIFLAFRASQAHDFRDIMTADGRNFPHFAHKSLLSLSLSLSLSLCCCHCRRRCCCACCCCCCVCLRSRRAVIIIRAPRSVETPDLTQQEDLSLFFLLSLSSLLPLSLSSLQFFRLENTNFGVKLPSVASRPLSFSNRK